MNNYGERKEITISVESAEDGNEYKYAYLKIEIQKAIEKFQIKIEQLPLLLGIPIEKIENILQDEPCVLKKEEESRASHRLVFLAEGFSSIDETERVRLIVNSILVEQYHFSYESLAKYADVPYDILKDFCENRMEIEPQYAGNIYVNLLMLHFILHG